MRLICDLAVGIWNDEALELRTLALVSGQPSQQLLARLSAQIHIAAPSHSKFRKKMNSWIARAERAVAARNRFVHQQLVFRDSPQRGGEVEWALYNARVSKRGFSADFSPTAPQELLRLDQNIGELTTDLFELVGAMIEENALPTAVRYRLVQVKKDEPPPWRRPN